MQRLLKFLIVFIIVGLFAGITYYIDYRPYKGTDDAYIYFVYAKNFTHGHGLVYAVGGEKVEGFTSVLWLMIISLFYYLGSHFQYALMFLNLVLVSYALYRIVSFIDTYYVQNNNKIISFPSLFFLTLILIVKGYTDWTIFSLLETGLWSSLLILNSIFLLETAMGVVRSSKQIIYFSFLLSLLVLARPEGLMWGLVFIVLFGCISLLQTGSRKKLIRATSLPLAAYLVTAVAITAFRLYYFGYPFPNTYYAKVSVNRIYNFKEGAIYFFKYLYIYPFHILAILAAVLSTVIIIKKRTVLLRDKPPGEFNYHLSQLINSIIVLIILGVPFITGGDHFSLFRLYQPAVPVFFVLLFNFPFIKKYLFGEKVFGKYGRYILPLSLLPVIYLMNMPKYFVDSEKVPYKVSLLNDFSFAQAHVAESRELNTFFDYTTRPSIGRIWAGGYAYGYDGPTVDLMGLNNTLMAHAIKEKIGLKNHAAFDKSTFYILKPDMLNTIIIQDTAHFILPENTPGFDESFDNEVLKKIFRDERFIQSYQPVIASNDKQSLSIFSYVRNDYIDTMRSYGLHVNILTRKQQSQ